MNISFDGITGDMEIRIFTCPNPECGFNVAETHYKYARYDGKCPRCSKHNLSTFTHNGKTYEAT